MTLAIQDHGMTELDVQMKRAQAMASAGESLPRQYRDNPAALLVAFEYADALNIPRVNALTGIHIVDGKPTASADLIGALVRKAGHKMRVEGDETYAEVSIIRADDPDYAPKPIRWDEQRARKAGLWGKKGPWQTYPGAMLRSRAITEAARMWASDALFGVVYTEEELTSETPRRVESTQAPQPSPPVEPTPDVEPVDVGSVIAAISEADSVEALKSIAAEIKGRIPNAEDYDRVLAAYKARNGELTTVADAAHDAAVESVQQALDAELVES